METKHIQTKKMGFPTYCSACGKERGRTELRLFIPTLQAFCSELSECGNVEKHPTHLKELYPNYVEYQVPLEPLRGSTVYPAIEKYYTESAVNELTRFMGKAMSARFNTEQVLYLLKYAEKKRFTSMQDVLRDIVNESIERDPYKLKDADLMKSYLNDNQFGK